MNPTLTVRPFALMPLFLRKPDFEATVRPELPVLLRVASHLSICEDDANDLVQRCLVKAFGAWKQFDGRFLRSWLIRILRNEHLMKIRHERALFEEIPLEPDFAEDEYLWQQTEWKDEAHRILDELYQLPLKYRMAVHLCDVEQLSYDEIALALEVPAGTVRSRVHRGRVIIRRKLCRYQEVVDERV